MAKRISRPINGPSGLKAEVLFTGALSYAFNEDRVQAKHTAKAK